MAVQVTGWWADPRATATLDVDPEFKAIVATSHGVHGATATVRPTFAAHLGHATKFAAAATVTPKFLVADLDRNTSAALTVTPTFTTALQNFKLAAETTVTPTFAASLQNSHVAISAHLIVAVAHSTTLSIGMHAALTVHPSFAPHVKFPSVTAAKTVTPALSAALHYTAHASATKTVTPTFSAHIAHSMSASKTVTPTFATTFSKVTAGLVAAKTVTPTLAATLKPREGAALTVTPQFSAGLQSHVTAAKTVTPTFSAVLHDNVHAAATKTVTPTFAATLARTIAAAKVVTPTFATTFYRNIAVSKTVTPTLAAALDLQAVTFDAVGSGFDSSSAAYPTATLTHSATAGAYVFVFVGASGAINTGSGVQYGSTAMTLLGSFQNPGDFSWLYLYGLSGAPSGSTTITINLSTDTYVAAQSISLMDVASVSSITTQVYNANSTSYSQSATPSTAGQWILQSFMSLQAPITAYSGGTGRALINLGGTSGEGELTISTATASATFTTTISSTASSDDLAEGVGMYVTLTPT